MTGSLGTGTRRLFSGEPSQKAGSESPALASTAAGVESVPAAEIDTSLLHTGNSSGTPLGIVSETDSNEDTVTTHAATVEPLAHQTDYAAIDDLFAAVAEVHRGSPALGPTWNLATKPPAPA